MTRGDSTLLSLFRKASKGTNGLVGVYVSATGIAIAQAKPAVEGKHQLLVCDYIAADTQASQTRLLSAAVSRLGLQGAAVNLVLPPSKYHLLMVEPPPVPDEEMKEAVRWRIKDLIDFDVESAAVDFFRIPEQAFRGRSPMIYVVVARRSVINDAQTLIGEAGLTLKFVDAAQLALCNLSQGWAVENQTIALLYLEQGESMLSLAKNDNLYLGRRIQTNVSALLSSGLAHDDAFNTLVLEMQRSMDYYESQLGQASATRIILMPMAAGDAHLSEELGDNLGIKVEVGDPADYFEGLDSVDTAVLPQCVLAIAGAMRQEAN